MKIKKRIQETDKAASARNGPEINKTGIDKTKKFTVLNSNLFIKLFYLN